jgi:CSLREA domain-containing protein
MSPILHRRNWASLLFGIALFAGLMSLPGGQGSVGNAFRPTVSAATTFTVTSTGDGADNNPGNGVCDDGTGLCTLRAAIQESNTGSGDHTINFNLPANSTITLNTALTSFNGNYLIAGPGSTLLTIQRSSAPGTPIFSILVFVGINGNFNDSVSGLTIANGNATGAFLPSSSGGGIFNYFGSALTLTDVVISGNTSNNGGGLYNQGNVTLTNCKIVGNTAGIGGGIQNTGTLNLLNSTVSGNSTYKGVSGAGKGGDGGGIYNGGGGTLSVVTSAITTNATGNGLPTGNPSDTDGKGGGIYNAGSATFINSTISGNTNSSGDSNGPGGQGAGIYTANSTTLTVSSCTITNNIASKGVGGSVGGGIAGNVTLGNTVIANNIANNAPDVTGLINSQDFNLIRDTSGASFTGATTHNITGLDPLLAPLADNGGPTQTHALLRASPAIDAGNSSLTTDQRGQPRPVDDQTVVNAAGSNASDIGAYEAHNLEVNSTADTDDGLCRSIGTGNGCTLREAISAANAQTGAELITFAPGLTSGGPATITLLTALSAISTDLTMSGPGAPLLTIERGASTPEFRIFLVNTNFSVIIAKVSVSNGSNANGGGAGLFNDGGSVTINDCAIKNALSGGGVYNFGGAMVINNSSITGNSGDGVFNTVPSSNPSVRPATLTLNNSSIAGNTGSGFLNNVIVGNASSPATATINNSSISGNSINGAGSAAAIMNSVGAGGTAILSINNSTIAGNTNSAGGTGGIRNATVFNGSAPTVARVTLTNTTISGNVAGTGAEAAGGISTLINSCSACTNTVRLQNTIVADNFSDAGTSASDITQPVDAASSYNLIGRGGSGGLLNGVNNNQVGLDPKLGQLGNNGGTTQTRALLPGSPALDAGNNAFVANPPFSGPPFTDQRGSGFARIVDGPDADTTDTVDIGAFEAQVSLVEIADQTINEDSSLSSPFNVGGSITSVTAASSNATLVPNDVANISVSGSGTARTLQINPAANQFGTSTITVTVSGANSQTMTDTFVLTVNAVNDAPSFTKGADQTVNENDGAQIVNNWATNISPGATNESSQTLSFSVTNNSNVALFSSVPAISPAGSLTYTPATGVSGAATITVALMDNGGIANGGADTSPTQSFNITVREGGILALSAATSNVVEQAGDAAITITRTDGSAGTATVLFATSNGTATSSDYTSVSQTVTFNDGEVNKTVNIPITDDLFHEPDETVNITLSNVGGSGALGSQTAAVLTILDNDPGAGYFQFSSPDYTVSEIAGRYVIVVERKGDTTLPATIDYATSDITADGRKDYTTTLGTLKFNPGVSVLTFVVLVNMDAFDDGGELIGLTLSNPTGGAALGSPANATLQIDNSQWNPPPANPIDNARRFVQQHYHDFLNRDPLDDPSGWDFWTNEITQCGSDAPCVQVKRINVSAAFFLSIEFQETGYLVERMYKAAFGDATGTSTVGSTHQLPVPIIRFNEFLPDSQEIGRGLVVGRPGWEQVLENNKVAFTQTFVQRLRFTTEFPTSLTPGQFVDQLFAHTGVTPTAAERNTAINEFGGAATSSDNPARARALRRVAENSTLNQNEKNRAFVLMQYFGYLRRNPNDPQDTDYTGYDFWLSKLNEFNGDFIRAEMVKAFLDSSEYRARFGP